MRITPISLRCERASERARRGRMQDALRARARARARFGMKLFLLPAGAYRELIIPNYLESMYLAKLPKSLRPPDNIMQELKMKLPRGRAGINSRSNYTARARRAIRTRDRRKTPEFPRRSREQTGHASAAVSIAVRNLSMSLAPISR